HSARERSRAIGIWAASSGISLVIGPIVGGVLLIEFWWGSVFLFPVPWVVLAVVMCALVVPESRAPSARRLDPIVLVLTTVGITLLVWGIIEAPGRGWPSPATLVTLGGGLAVLGVFVAWERRCEHPMLDLHLFRIPSFSAGTLASCTNHLAIAGVVFVVV